MKFEDKIDETLETIDEVVAPAGTSAAPAPITNNQQAPANPQQVPAPNQQQAAPPTAGAVLSKALQANPQEVQEIVKALDAKPDDEATFNAQAQAIMALGQEQADPNAAPVNPTAPSNPTTSSATPVGGTSTRM